MTDENKKTLRTWLNPKGYGIQRVSWLFMRISGIFLLVFFIVHVIHSASILDRLTWGQLLLIAYSPTGFIILSVMMALGAFHTINGIRLMLNQGGIGVGSPKRQDFPYNVESMNKKNRLCIYVSIGVSVLVLYYALGVLFKF